MNDLSDPPDATSASVSPAAAVAAEALTVVFEDAHVVVVNKPAGLSAIPERDLAQPSAQRQLEAARADRLFVVHRIDKEVSGLLIFARDAATHRALSMAFEQRKVHKRYLGLAWGALPLGDSGELSMPIHEFGSGRMGVDARGKASLTRWKSVALGALPEGPVTLLELEPHTGRRHQLRVHAYAFGHPLVGDPRYGDPALQKTQPRLALHAYTAKLSLGEVHYDWVVPLPSAFATLLVSAGLSVLPSG